MRNGIYTFSPDTDFLHCFTESSVEYGLESLDEGGGDEDVGDCEVVTNQELACLNLLINKLDLSLKIFVALVPALLRNDVRSKDASNNFLNSWFKSG